MIVSAADRFPPTSGATLVDGSCFWHLPNLRAFDLPEGSCRSVSNMLKGSKPGLVKKIQPVSIHGQLSLDVYFVDPEDPQGQVSLARIGPEAVPRNLEIGDVVEMHYTLGAVTQITRRL